MFEGTWLNDYGSQLKVGTIQTNGTFEGTYQTAVGDPDTIGKEEALIGRTKDQLIAFIVDFDGTGSMTTWMGRYEKDEKSGEERIRSVWTLGRTVEGENDEPVEIWASFLTNANTFVKQAQPA